MIFNKQCELVKSFTMMKLRDWSKPQRINKDSPLGKTLRIVKERIKAQAKIEKNIGKKTPEVNFFRQTFRNSEEKKGLFGKVNVGRGERPKSAVKSMKKIVVVRENQVEMIEIVARKRESKSLLRTRLGHM